MDESYLKKYRREIILLLSAVILSFLLGEVVFRFYYWFKGEPVAADQNELCLKNMKLASNYVSVQPDSFVYKPWWAEHPLIGLLPKPNYTGDDAKTFLVSLGKVKHAVVYEAQHHNSQGLTNVEEFKLRKPDDGRLRIALFGDSFTCGSEGPLRFNVPSVLNELVPNSEVLNFCVLGMGIDTMYARYVIEGKQYAPDVVVFNVLVDDLRRAFDCQLFKPNLKISDGKIIIAPRAWPTLRDFYFNYQPPRFESYFFKHLLWVYNAHTKFRRDMLNGLSLFSVMVDDLKAQTAATNITLIISVISAPNPTAIEDDVYAKMISLLRQKNITFVDSADYFAAKKVGYSNQSFYYIKELDKFGHFSPVGNAVFAQKIKNVLEELGRIPVSPNYYFANFKTHEFLYLIPESITLQRKGQVRMIRAFDVVGENESESTEITLFS
ncbi:SGNH/GDSL hydrolase family protein [Candidatus Woesearchaeota archaeon]|nr:SGNH/GDSL hydrolase family protein [Candidatus Woesearchaeota archaeon]